ncbi:hypothetical protein CC86DRAFT_460437 [Ophiobolus disseminans]|uniref:Uncharacterized protein n=1 Tax=Ophiobolus disseminans TaxID=1469910 RepID=A0A6A6ZEY8_9PLEO|nr:hypothetical protein CC86DRAFT_460437 [Ophiobolus disseminans]
MKRKFSFNMAPVKMASKTDGKPTPEPTPSHTQSQSASHSQSHSHGRDSSKDSISDFSPFISRRALDTQTDRELRQACKLILQNFKPSDHGMEDTDPKLDFGGPQRREQRTRDRNADRPEPKVRLPTGAPVDLKTALEARGLQQTELTLRTGNDAPVRANSSRKRADFAWLDDRDGKREANLRKSSSQRRRPPPLENPAAIADAEATEWMQKERAKQDASNPEARPPTAVRPPSRSRSIRENIKDYVFPGTASRTLSRAPSHTSLRTTNTRPSLDSEDPTRTGAANNWRSWSLRRSASRSNSRPGTSKGKPEEPDSAKKTNPHVVNLNRELPPLPSLDSWKDQQSQPAPEPLKSPTSGAHIASLMRPQEQPQPERVTANRKSHRKSGSDTLAMQFNASMDARSPTSNRHPVQAESRSKTLTPDNLTGGSHTLVGSASTSHLGHARHKSTESRSTPRLSGEAGNFSRKMSVDNTTHSTSSNDGKLSRKEEQKSRLKKVFTGWMTKKEKKEDWMHRIEKEGVKEGVLVADPKAGTPVVRY